MPPNILPCRSCGARIFFAPSATTNALMRIDAEPVADGNITLLDGKAHVHNGSLFEEMVPENEPRYKSHFATCPAHEKHRNPKPKAK